MLWNSGFLSPEISQGCFLQTGSDHADFASDFRGAGTDLSFLGNIIKVDPCTFRCGYHSLGAKNNTIGITVIQLRKDGFDFFLRILTGRFHAPALEDLIRVMPVMVVMMVRVAVGMIDPVAVFIHFHFRVVMIMMMVVMIMLVIVVMMVVMIMFILVIIVVMMVVMMLMFLFVIIVVMMVVMMLMFLFVIIVVMMVVVMIMFILVIIVVMMVVVMLMFLFVIIMGSGAVPPLPLSSRRWSYLSLSG